MKDATEIEREINILLREYETLRAEILERLKLAFQPLAWAGAIVAFAVPMAINKGVDIGWSIFFIILGCLPLVWISRVNWRWLVACSHQIQRIEVQVQEACHGSQLLTWERRTEDISRGCFWLPLLDDQGASKYIPMIKTTMEMPK